MNPTNVHPPPPHPHPSSSSSAPPHPINPSSTTLSSSSSSLTAPPPLQNPSSSPSSSSSSAPQYPPPPPPGGPTPTAPAATPLGPSRLPLDEYNWIELEERFLARMDSFGKEERDLQEEFGNWVAVFTAWAGVTSVWEEERGYKRLRTRISWVQNAEKNLEEKRLHYVTAIKAFENVVALLNGF